MAIDLEFVVEMCLAYRMVHQSDTMHSKHKNVYLGSTIAAKHPINKKNLVKNELCQMVIIIDLLIFTFKFLRCLDRCQLASQQVESSGRLDMSRQTKPGMLNILRREMKSVVMDRPQFWKHKKKQKEKGGQP